MGINKLIPASSGIFPTKPYNAELTQLSLVTDTYYTIVNVTSGKGKINAVFIGTSTTNNNVPVTLKITIDGTAYTYTASTSYNGARTQHYASSAGKAMAFFPEVYFNTSAKVEVAVSGADSGQTLYGACDYALV